VGASKGRKKKEEGRQKGREDKEKECW